ncbi:hypothetical protein [Thioclava sp. GXIMD4216]|uniref:hypothetical protein n=1 Tax=Thioclava sp. GXIMD4216 TaxID=3131929 RepID=UPI0030D411EA
MTLSFPHIARGAVLAGALLALAACGDKPLDGPDALVDGAARAVPAGYQIAQSPSGLIVMRDGAPFAADEGAEAKKVLSRWCGAQGVNSGLDDSFSNGTWVFPGGCK